MPLKQMDYQVRLAQIGLGYLQNLSFNLSLKIPSRALCELLVSDAITMLLDKAMIQAVNEIKIQQILDIFCLYSFQLDFGVIII